MAGGVCYGAVSCRYRRGMECCYGARCVVVSGVVCGGVMCGVGWCGVVRCWVR